MKWLNELRHQLPQQAPLKDFIHHNTLHDHLHLSFDTALAESSAAAGARPYLSLAEFRRLYVRGRIQEWALEQAVDDAEASPLDRAELRDQLFEAVEPEVSPRAFPFRVGLRERHGIDLDLLAHPTIIRYTSAYLDQGVAILRPIAPGHSYWWWLAELEATSAFPLIPGLTGSIRREVRLLLQTESPEEVIRFCLSELAGGAGPEVQEAIAMESALSLPGWSGMVSVVERTPKILYERRQISLEQFMAFKLLVEWAMLKSRLRNLEKAAVSLKRDSRCVNGHSGAFDKWRLHRIWQEAYERSVTVPYLKALAQQANAVTQSRRDGTKKPRAQVQAIFCLDEREGSLRRHLEELSPLTNTFGAAGFFGLDCEFRSLQDRISIQQCPAPVTPQYLLEERPRETHLGPGVPHPLPLPFRGAVRTTLGGWAFGLVGIVDSGCKLLGSIWGELRHEHVHVRSIEDNASDMLVFSSEFEEGDSELIRGFEIPQAADRAEKLLREMGLTDEFCPLVVFVAHGSQNANNAHFAAYDCGACSGKPGALNAKAIAKLLDSVELRAELARRGIVIPDSTYFLGTYHDTCTDELVIMDRHRVPATHGELLTAWICTMEEALERNAWERCRRFETIPRPKDATTAADAVKKRALAIYEPRPELGHATNTFCIIGRRELTKSLCWDRRAFHVSYDPMQDPTGKHLLGLLQAAIPVCGGINLEYYFSRVDSEVYGAGSKLPHNVNALLGVSNGAIADLRPGLPWQMVDFHEPLRLVMVLEQNRETVCALMRQNHELFRWITNHWIHLYLVDPDTGEMSAWSREAGAGFNSFQADDRVPDPVKVSSWLDVCKMGSEPLPVLERRGVVA